LVERKGTNRLVAADICRPFDVGWFVGIAVSLHVVAWIIY
jgi:hypothetical protein